jgi:hypothetical protein
MSRTKYFNKLRAFNWDGFGSTISASSNYNLKKDEFSNWWVYVPTSQGYFILDSFVNSSSTIKKKPGINHPFQYFKDAMAAVKELQQMHVHRPISVYPNPDDPDEYVKIGDNELEELQAVLTYT